MLAGWRRSLVTGQPYEVQCRFRRNSDSAYRWHLGRALPTRDESGAIVEWVGSCADIHDYKIATETRAILDTIGSIVSIRTQSGFVDYTSPYWSQYTGSIADSGLGFGWRDYVHPDDIDIVDALRAPDSDARSHECEIRILASDGIYRWFLMRSTMLPLMSDGISRWLDTSTPIDDLKSAQSALASSEARSRALTESMPQMVWVIDAAGQFEYVNVRWAQYTGLGLEPMRVLGTSYVIHPEDLAGLLALRGGSERLEFVTEARVRRADGTYRWHVIRAVPFRDGAGESEKWIATATDIEARKTAADALASTAAELEHLAYYDTVTNLPNRKLLTARLNAAISLAQRGRSGVIVLYLDLDRFKAINDTHGHAAGDRVLAVTGQRIADALRSGDTASRVGGDEFVLVCATSDGHDDAVRLADRLHVAIGAPIELEDTAVSVDVSIGISLYPDDGRTCEELIGHADAAMYEAKQSGRNAFRLYNAGMG